MTWVLIVIVMGGGTYRSSSVAMQEFSTEPTCTEAANVIRRAFDTIPNYSKHSTAVAWCVSK